MTVKVAAFDSFAYACKHFTTEPWVNNGYGCNHPDQEEVHEDNEGKEGGCCYCFSCPLGIEADEAVLKDPHVDWCGLCDDGEVSESEYLLVNVGPDATEDEKDAWDRYERYINRYNPDWKKNKSEAAVHAPCDRRD